MIKRIKHQGTALIAALFITALVATISVALIEHFQVDIRRTELIQNDTRAYFTAQGSVAWAMDTLVTNLKQQHAGTITDKTPIKSPISETHHAKIYSVILDAEANFNLNNLRDLSYQENFKRLLKSVYPTLSEEAAKALLSAIQDWNVSHNPMVSISEIRTIKGVTADIFTALSPYISALPVVTPININNAASPVLMSLSPTLTKEAADTIVAHQNQSPFLSLQDFLNFDIVKNSGIAENKVTTQSSYFLLETHVVQGEQHMILYTLLLRVMKNSQPRVVILWQSKGTL